MDLNDLFKQLAEELKNGNYSQDEKMAIIKNVGEMYQSQLDDEKENWLLTSYDNTAQNVPNNTSRTPDIARDYVGMTPPTYSGSYN